MTLKEFIKHVLGNPSNIQEKYPLGKITDEQAKKIQDQTGLDVHGYNRVIDNFGLQHIIKKHGNEKMKPTGDKYISPKKI